MDKDKVACSCPCFCDPSASRIFDQTGARYNDQSAFANNQSQLNFLMMQSQFQATAQNTLEKHGTADMMLQLRSVGNQPGA